MVLAEVVRFLELPLVDLDYAHPPLVLENHMPPTPSFPNSTSSYLQKCLSFCSHRGGVPTRGVWLLGRGCLLETPGHCSGGYTSYWNAFLFTIYSENPVPNICQNYIYNHKRMRCCRIIIRLIIFCN